MKKFLVTTDFSSSSKAALRFAIQLSSQSDCHLTFFHSYKILKPTGWNDIMLDTFENNQASIIQKKLIRFVKEVYQSMKVEPKYFECIIKHGQYAYRNILKFAEDNNYDYICISRKGIGKARKLFGSTISKFITKSDVPVIAVPENYRRQDISKICYASDLSRLDDELVRVTNFASPLKADVEVLHFKIPIDYLRDNKEMKNIREKLSEHKIQPRFELMDYEKTLIQNITKVLRRSKPSLLIMFTRQKRSLFEKIFISSISTEYAFITKTPLLIFNK